MRLMIVLVLLSACVVETGDDELVTDDVESEATVPTPVTALADQQHVTISGAAGSTRYFKIDVPANFDRVYVERTGDGIQTPTHQGADIYMKRGALPSTTSYDCRFMDGSSGNCKVDRPAAGTYYIMVRGTTGYSMELWAHYYNMYSPIGNNTSLLLGNGIGQDAYLKLIVPTGMDFVKFAMALDGEQTGEAEVFVKIGGFASETNYDCSFGIGYYYSTGDGECRFDNPIGNTYYIKILTHRRYYATFTALYRYPITSGTLDTF
jgi:hypothetical protein